MAGAREGNPGAVLVAGEAGGGKTRLVRALLDDVPPETFVVRAQCVDLGDPGLPNLTMVDVVRAVEAVAGADSRVESVLDGLPVLAALTDPNAPGDVPADESRQLQLFDAVASLLAEVGRVRGPVVVTIEDLQWMDSSSASFLRFLLSRMLSERLVVVATVRTDGLAARPRLRQLLSEIGRLPSVERLDLEPFDAAEVAEYLARADVGGTDPDFATEVFRRTRGNPYYVQMLAAAGGPTGRQDEMPRALADLLVGRLDGLPDDARSVVQCAAAAGHSVPDRLLRQVMGLPDAVMDDAVRVAVAEGLLRPDGAGYSFAHDLLRSAVYDDLLPGERARWHAAQGAVLASGSAGPARPAEVAHHFTEAQDAPKVLVWSMRAAEEATRVQAPSEALQHLERALAAWPDVDGAATLVGESNGRAMVRAARAAGLAGEPTRGIEWARRAIQLCDAEQDTSSGAEARAELARQLLAVDATDQAEEPAEEAVRLVERTASTRARRRWPTSCSPGSCSRLVASTRRGRRLSVRSRRPGRWAHRVSRWTRSRRLPSSRRSAAIDGPQRTCSALPCDWRARRVSWPRSCARTTCWRACTTTTGTSAAPCPCSRRP